MTKQAKAPKAPVVLDDVQASIARKYSALSTKGADAWNGLTSYSQSFMQSAVLFDGSWSEEAIEDLNKSLKAIQSKLERKSTGYSTFSSCKAVILKAYRLGVADVRKPKSELEAECKALKPEAQESEASGEAEAPSTESPQALIERAMALLIAQGDDTPCQTLIKYAHGYVNKKQK
jgi:hypothetical protein